MLVEDYEDAAEALKEFLEDEGYKVALAHNGKAALKLISTTKPDLILLDVGLPDMPCTDVVEGIRAESPHYKIVLMTAATKNEIEKVSSEIKPIAAIRKPFDIFSFIKFVKELLK